LASSRVFLIDGDYSYDEAMPTAEASQPTLATLYPNLTPEQLEEASARLDEYLSVILEIAEDIERDPALQRQFADLTQARRAARMERITGTAPSSSHIHA
jgi:hypothetical protein